MSYIADEFGVAQPDGADAGRAEKCKLCHYFNEKDSTCHLLPSQRVGVVFANATSVRAADTWGWPIVKEDDWCGEWMAEGSLLPAFNIPLVHVKVP